MYIYYTYIHIGEKERSVCHRPVVADKRVYCHEALALHAKLHDAGYCPEAEPWDEPSGSDSDQTDEADEADELLRLMV